MNRNGSVKAQLDRIRSRSLLVGGVAAILAIVGAIIDPHQFFQSYLLGFILCLAVSLGCMALVMIHHLTGGGWGFLIQRQLEAGAKIIPFMGLLFVPLLFGLDDLYPWLHHHEGSGHEIIARKSEYLNLPFFLIRAVLYFLIWSGIAIFLSRWSQRQDETGDPDYTQRMKIISGPGFVLYAITATFASVDWIMSLEPEWFSTIYGLLFMVCHGLAALSFVIILTFSLRDRIPLRDFLASKYYHNLGNLLLAMVLLWAYMSFSQFLITWSGNLPEEVSWYVNRIGPGWQIMALVLVLFHFALPFLVLLSRRSKRHVHHLVKIAGWMLLMRYLDFFWWIKPAFANFSIHWMDLVLPLALGGLWLGLFSWQLAARPLMPLHDPRLKQAFGTGEVLTHG